MRVRLNKFCFCCSIETGTVFVGISSLLLSLMTTASSSYNLTLDSYTITKPFSSSYYYEDEDIAYLFRAFCVVLLLLSVAWLLCSILLLWGLKKKHSMYLLPWIFCAVCVVCINMLLSTIFVIKVYMIHSKVYLIWGYCFYLFVFAFEIYCILCVLSHYRNMKNRPGQFALTQSTTVDGQLVIGFPAPNEAPPPYTEYSTPIPSVGTNVLPPMYTSIPTEDEPQQISSSCTIQQPPAVSSHQSPLPHTDSPTSRVVATERAMQPRFSSPTPHYSTSHQPAFNPDYSEYGDECQVSSSRGRDRGVHTVPRQHYQRISASCTSPSVRGESLQRGYGSNNKIIIQQQQQQQRGGIEHNYRHLQENPSGRLAGYQATHYNGAQRHGASNT